MSTLTTGVTSEEQSQIIVVCACIYFFCPSFTFHACHKLKYVEEDLEQTDVQQFVSQSLSV